VQTLERKSLPQAAVGNGEVVANWRALSAFCRDRLRCPAIPGNCSELSLLLTAARRLKSAVPIWADYSKSGRTRPSGL
jgi:hypothetical protein